MDKNEWISRFDDLICSPSIREFYGEREFFNVGYWLSHTQDQQEASSTLMEKLLEFIPNKQGTILDVGCGLGATTHYLLKYYPLTAIVGINISPTQIARSLLNFPEGKFLLMDAVEMDFADHSFEQIICVEAAFYFNTRRQFLQEAFGELRVFDTGIRENTIIGQGVGMAMRGLRPIAEIQYLDYLIYALQIMSDDLATLQYRTKGGQKAPLIISTRGHRLEGIWHSGSPMGMIINSVRGMVVCVPRNMTKAAGFYNTLLQSDDCALVIEPLNGYRLKERKPVNFGEFKTPIGIPEVVIDGSDLTLVSYGSTFNICEKACSILKEFGVSIELIDVQTLLPFDVNHLIKKSLEKTNRLLLVDEDVSGGACGFMLDKILVEQKAYFTLDSAPQTLTAKDHRPAYGSDGDYFSKPNLEDIVEKVLEMMHEVDPVKFPKLY